MNQIGPTLKSKAFNRPEVSSRPDFKRLITVMWSFWVTHTKPLTRKRFPDTGQGQFVRFIPVHPFYTRSFESFFTHACFFFPFSF